jgi:DNA cross-link repair 1A protein
VKRDKKKIIECLNDNRLKNLITLNPKETNLHVLPMGNVNIKDLIGYLANFSEYDRIIGVSSYMH